jgi:hypothetical protein
MAVPDTTLTLTDRLAVKLYATNSGGKTTTIHTQDGHLCQIITTFSTGITALNGLTAQIQYFQTGTSGTDFNISSTTATHTFNLPTASAANRGALSSADWSVFNTKQNAITLTTTGTSGAATLVGATLNIPQYQAAGTYVTSVTASAPLSSSGSTNPNITITQVSSTVDGYLSFSDYNVFSGKISGSGTAGYITRYTGSGSTIGNSGLYDDGTTVSLISRALSGSSASFGSSVTATSFVKTGGTSAQFLKADGSVDSSTYLTTSSAASTYLPLAGGTLTGALGGTSATFSGEIKSGDTITLGAAAVGGFWTWGATTSFLVAGTGKALNLNPNGSSGSTGLSIATTGAATFSSSVTAQLLAISNGYYLVGRNAANTAFRTLLTFDSSNKIIIGQDSDITSVTIGVSTANLTIASTGAATFSSSVTANSSIISTTIYGGTFKAYDGTNFVNFGSYFNTIGSGNSYDGVIYTTHASSALYFMTGGSTTAKLTIASTGNVGIGITNPSAKLHSYNGSSGGTVSSNSNLLALETNGNNGMQFLNPSGNNANINFGDEFASEIGFIQYQHAVDAMRFRAGGTTIMSLVGGNVLIGTTTDEGYKLYVNGGSSNGFLFYSTSAANQIKAAGTAPAITFSNTITSPTIGGSLGACTSAGQFLSGTAAGDMILINQFTGNKLYITNYSGGVYLTQGATSWTANSDIRLKNINSHIENAVEKLSTLQTINFSYKDDKFKKQNLGLIAQEVEKIFPELIDKNGDGMLGVRYTELVPVLIKAVQELKAEIETLKNK